MPYDHRGRPIGDPYTSHGGSDRMGPYRRLRSNRTQEWSDFAVNDGYDEAYGPSSGQVMGRRPVLGEWQNDNDDLWDMAERLQNRNKNDDDDDGLAGVPAIKK